ncbi:hypothetical protein NQ317_013498 [Molorchus minor]|uniref:PEP-utilising enzyme mobile domain-containing protein n=1 Tax=Molorchus minor TaxID=1323400 RepID=A0ABQ9JWJ1_9CUCU|nr:hypothetical protein NQ317_013498 [Molorchus minor]
MEKSNLVENKVPEAHKVFEEFLEKHGHRSLGEGNAKAKALSEVFPKGRSNRCRFYAKKCSGTPVCTGSVKGRACVINNLDEIDQLQEGDILITYSTDIGWSPYFPMLSGIVTELGGLISHGAVVAREYGLPCIVGVKNATKFFSNW